MIDIISYYRDRQTLLGKFGVFAQISQPLEVFVKEAYSSPPFYGFPQNIPHGQLVGIGYTYCSYDDTLRAIPYGISSETKISILN